MAKDKKKVGSTKSDKQSEAKPTVKKDEKQSSNSAEKHVAATPVFFALAVLIIGVCAFMTYSYVNKDSKEVTGTEEVELSHAEELEQRKLVDSADQDDHNSVNLGLADAYYREQNYGRALELLELIENPSEQIILAYNKVYGAVLIGLGRDEEAFSYNQAVLKVSEDSLIASAEQDPIGYYNLGKLYADTGQTDKAIESYQKVIDAYENGSAVRYESYNEEIVELAEQAIEDLQ